MRYVSIDLETTGLDPNTCQILEIGAVIDDLANLKPLDELPSFHAYVVPQSYEGQEPLFVGQAFALQMNAAILKKIALRKENKEDNFVLEEELASTFKTFLRKNGYAKPDKVVAAGKNYGTFDKLFLEQLPEWGEVRFHHRIIDPAMLFIRKGDLVPPNLSLCLERAGLPNEVKHTAVADALQVIQLVRKGLGYEG